MVLNLASDEGIRIRITADASDAKDDLEETEDAVEGVGRQASLAAVQLEAMGAAADDAGDEVGHLGGVVDITATRFRALTLAAAGVGSVLAPVAAGLGAVVASGGAAYAQQLARNLKNTDSAAEAAQARLKLLGQQLATVAADQGRQFTGLISSALRRLPLFARRVFEAFGNLRPFAQALRTTGAALQQIVPEAARLAGNIGRRLIPTLTVAARELGGLVNGLKNVAVAASPAFNGLLRVAEAAGQASQQVRALTNDLGTLVGLGGAGGLFSAAADAIASRFERIRTIIRSVRLQLARLRGDREAATRIAREAARDRGITVSDPGAGFAGGRQIEEGRPLVPGGNTRRQPLPRQSVLSRLETMLAENAGGGGETPAAPTTPAATMPVGTVVGGKTLEEIKRNTATTAQQLKQSPVIQDTACSLRENLLGPFERVRLGGGGGGRPAGLGVGGPARARNPATQRSGAGRGTGFERPGARTVELQVDGRTLARTTEDVTNQKLESTRVVE